jgi:hypothetical protein
MKWTHHFLAVAITVGLDIAMSIAISEKRHDNKMFVVSYVCAKEFLSVDNQQEFREGWGSVHTEFVWMAKFKPNLRTVQ